MTDPSSAASPPTGGPRPLTRSGANRVVAGVAGGLGQYLGIDPVIVRVVFVVLAVAGGSGVALYGLGWLLIPEEGSERSVGAQLYDRYDRYDRGDRGDGVDRVDGADRAERRARLPTPALLLIIVGVVLFFGRLRARGLWGLPAAALVVVAAGVILGARRHSQGGSSRGLAPWWVWTIGGVLVTLGIVQLLISWSWGWPVVAILAVGGLVLAAAARQWVGAVLLLIVLVASGAGAAWQAGVGDRLYRPDATIAGHRGYRLGVGQLTVDLSSVGTSRLTDVNAHVGVGHLIVVIPTGLSVRIHGSASVGDVVILGDHQSGTRIREDVADGPAAPTPVRISASVGVGQVDVERAPLS